MNNILKISCKKDIYLRAKQSKISGLDFTLEIDRGHLFVIQNKWWSKCRNYELFTFTIKFLYI